MFRIEICGGIATGKTTLAQRLAEVGNIGLMREPYWKVPFWEKFYSSPGTYEFEKNISFLLFHADCIRATTSTRSDDRWICDFAFFQDLAYASLSKNRQDVPILESVFRHLVKRFPCPSILIDVTCSPTTQIDRIRKRGRKPELTIEEGYLRKLRSEIDARLREFLGGHHLPIVKVNTDEINILYDSEKVDDIWRQIISTV